MNIKDNFPQNNAIGAIGEEPVTDIFDDNNQSQDLNSSENKELNGLDDLWDDKKTKASVGIFGHFLAR